MTVGTHLIGPLLVAGTAVTIRTNCPAFAELATAVFGDMIRPSAHGFGTATVVFDTIRHDSPSLHWSIYRDGQPCELDLRNDAVIVHQQWELNRLVIESSPTAVHSAVVAVNGRAVLLAGQSHSGKTTLAGWLAGQPDVEFLADEVAAFSADDVVNPYPRPLGLRPGSPTVAQAWRTDPLAVRFMPDEQLVPIGALGGSVRPSAAPVALIVFPRFDADADRVRVEHISQAEAIQRLAQLTPGLVSHGRQVFDQLCRLVMGSPAISLSFSSVAAASQAVLAMVAAQVGGPLQ